MSVNPSAFGPMPQFVNLIGEPAAGDKLFFYIAGTNTKLDTFTDSTGLVANTNPIVLDALGNSPYEIWWTSGSLYKMVWAPSTDTDPPVSAYRTVDNLRGMNDFQTTAVTFDEWLVYGAAATYISDTSFSVTGNQTNTFQIGRRIKTTNTGGTVYSTITNSVFGAVTTVTVRNDSGVIDSGLSAVAYGVLSVTNPSIPFSGKLFASEGYQRLPGGLIVQWGFSTAIAAGVSGTITFPIAFPTACRGVYPTIYGQTLGTTNAWGMGASDFTTSGATLWNNGNNGPASACWFAIGY